MLHEVEHFGDMNDSSYWFLSNCLPDLSEIIIRNSFDFSDYVVLELNSISSGRNRLAGFLFSLVSAIVLFIVIDLFYEHAQYVINLTTLASVNTIVS